MSIDPRGGATGGGAGARRRYLLPYERRLADRRLQRWRSSTRYDLAQTEHRDGSESVRLFAAWQAGFQLAKLVGFLGAAVFAVGGGFYGVSGFLAGAAVIAACALIAITAAIRLGQSGRARKEYQNAEPSTPQ